MSEEALAARHDHVRAVTISVSAALSGIFAAVLSTVLTADLSSTEAATAVPAISMLVLAVLIQIPLYRAMGFDEYGGSKDVLYVGFMTFALWFITFGIVLSTGIELP